MYFGVIQMSNLWILTEERPKVSVIKTILEQYCNDFHVNGCFADSIRIKPIVDNNKFTFEYLVEGAEINEISRIVILIVSGKSSFVDYMVIKQSEKPLNSSLRNVLMAIEETKTSDAESRNTGIYQRASKFVYIDYFCPNVKKYMLYNEEMTPDNNRVPTDTNIFGTNMLLTVGVKFIGKNMDYFSTFNNIDELIELKSRMRNPNRTNTPIHITKSNDCIYISGKLDKRNQEGKISHDPNIGALTCIGYTLRKLGWTGDIIITNHNITQNYVNRANNNKCLILFQLLNIKMQGLRLRTLTVNDEYWEFCKTSEKVASIFLHLTCMYSGINGIYENHAGCERGYFITNTGEYLALPKKDKNNNNLLLPDVILCDHNLKKIYNVEGKLLSTMYNGIAEVETYDSIENEYIKLYYNGYSIERWVSIFGGKLNRIPHAKILIYLNDYGQVYINNAASENIKNAFNRIGIVC